MFDSQRKTANLFDKSSTAIHNAYFNDADRWLPADDSRSIVIPVKGGTQYTLSIPEAMSVFRICEASQEPVIENTYSRIVRASSAIDRYTFTTQNDTKYIIFQGGRATVDTWFNGLMLNSGSTPLPYEPYWQHSLRKLDTSTDTLTTLPVDLYADGTNATVGLVGNMSQTGTPTPTTPISPSETGEMTENLFDYTKTDGIIANMYINQSGAIVADNEYYISYPIKVNVGETYAWRFVSNSSTTGHTAPTVGFYDSSDNLLSTAQHNVKVKYFSFEVPANCAYIRASVFTRSNAQKEAMLNTGSTPPSSYIPYGYKIPISSASTTTPVYLGEVETTRKIKKLVLDGTENFTKNGNNFMLRRNDLMSLSPAIYIYSTHYANSQTSKYVRQYTSTYWSETPTPVIGIYDGDYSSASNFKAFLASEYANGTPVTIWYILAEPTTGIVNEPLRKIGNYADTVSGITIPTITGKDSFDVQTTLKPSEVSLAYTGWHDATVKEWDGSEWQ